MPFAPTDFTQVNSAINRVLVRRALALLDPQPGERIADFFCGLGNFTLPIARRGAIAVGVEGSASLVQRAEANARHNGLSDRARFVVANLFAATPESIAALGPLDRVLIDPPREGGIELVKSLPRARRRRRPFAHRLRLVQSGHTGPRRRGAGARARVPARRCRRRQHVPAHGARRVDRAVRKMSEA